LIDTTLQFTYIKLMATCRKWHLRKWQ